jgi:hypothetical protein
MFMKTALETLIEALETNTWTPPVDAAAESFSRRTEEAAVGLQKNVCWHCQDHRECSCISCVESMQSGPFTGACVVCQEAKAELASNERRYRD